jgi:methionyl-tRNA synthetase
MEAKQNSFYVTTPIYYVNDVPHIGHAYTTLAADVLARYKRLAENRVFFLTGIDEHGQKVQEAAKKKGIDPIAHCNEMVVPFQNLWKKFNFSHNDFIRTTEERHMKVVQNILQYLYEKGDIYQDSYNGWYCMYEEIFLTEKDLVEGNCPVCNRPVSQISESNYFFRMGKYQEWLIDYINTHDDFIQPKSRRNEVLGFLNNKLGDLCISRPKERLSWGIPLPFDENYVTYVWFDALLNYISASGYLSDPDGFQSLWDTAIHLIGKDILTTHAVYWPTMLKAIGLNPPKTIFAHGWWTAEGKKMSKSIGNVVEPNALVETYGVDQVRYFLLREVPFGLDGDFSQSALINRINSDLANDLGNLLSRTLTMIKKYFDSVIPEPDTVLKEDTVLAQKSEAMQKEIDKQINSFNFQKALISIWGFLGDVNKYIDDSAPWNLAKEKNEKRLSTVMYHTAESLRILAIILSPFLPGTSRKIWNQLGINDEFDSQGLEDLKWGALKPGTRTDIKEQLFPRIEDKTKEEKPMKEQKEDKEPSLSTIDDLMKLSLRAGRIIKAEKVEKSKKLIKLEVDLGEETRTVVAGIAESYSPDVLIGKDIILVANLKPATIMGIESNGMVLAGETDGEIILATFEKEVKPGSKIK